MATYKRQTHGIRLNLVNLDQDIQKLERDLKDFDEFGYVNEARAVRTKLKQLYAMRGDAVKHGYGYYTYKRRTNGKLLVTAVALALLAVLIIGWFLVVFG